MEPFRGLVHTWLTDWYRLIVFSETPREAAEVYRTGLATLEDMLGRLEWEPSNDRLTSPDGEGPLPDSAEADVSPTTAGAM